ncbi:MAG: ABC transporter ATP-binding protein [Victivallaceae bacterium]|nr:ABC transporter ATP-binding protein [Victivallaceae bacterium]
MTAVIKKLRILLAPGDKARLLGVAVLMSVGALLEIVGIWLVLPVVAVFVKPEMLEQNPYLSWFYRLCGIADHRAFMIFCCLLLVGIYALKNLFSLAVVHVQAAFVFRKYWEWCERLYRTYLLAPYRYHLDHSAAELNNNIVRVSQVCYGFLLPAMLLLTDVLAVLALAVVLFFFMPWVTLGCAAFMLIAASAIYLPTRMLNARWGRQAMDSDMAAARGCMGGLQGVKAVKAAGAEDFFAARYRRFQRDYCRYSRKLYVLGQVPRFGMETVAIFGALGLLMTMLLIGCRTETILLTFSLLVAAMSRMLPAFSRMHYNLTRMRQMDCVFDSMFTDMTSVEPEYLGMDGGAEAVHLRERLEIRDIVFGYGNGPVLDHFSLDIPARTSTALAGATGCGKSTLADLIQGFLIPDEGAILADGVNISENLRAWRRIVGSVPQFIYLMDDSIRANVALGVPPDDIDDERVWESLKLAQADGFVAAMPDKLATKVGDNGVKLSGGQRQRLGIARALYRRPELLILDEATSALDGETESAFVDALEAIRGRMTVLVIAHRPSAIEKCDRVVRLDGRISER